MSATPSYVHGASQTPLIGERLGAGALAGGSLGRARWAGALEANAKRTSNAATEQRNTIAAERLRAMLGIRSPGLGFTYI